MKWIQNTIFWLCFLLLCNTVLAQQQSLFSQYIFNLYAVNPAYAGARDALSMNASYRAQWVGFEGAPTTQNFNIHGPLRNQNMALGIQFQNDQIGARKAPFIGVAYAYKLRLDKSGKKLLSMGIQGGAINYQYDWNALEYKNPGDPVAFSTDGNFWVPNVDFGMMYLSDKSYIGMSVSGLQRSRLNNLDLSDARLSTFINFNAGHVFVLSDDVALKPFTMLRHNMNGPAQFDLGLSSLLLNTFWLGVVYRYDFGMVFSAQFIARKRLVIGYAYDWALNSLRATQSGTHELYLGYDLDIMPRSKTTVKYY